MAGAAAALPGTSVGSGGVANAGKCGAGPRPACLLSVCVNPRLVMRRTARLPPGHLQCGRRPAQRTRADSQRRRAGAWCSGEGRPQRWPAHRLHNPTALSQETGDSHTGDSHAGASVQRGAGQSLQCARPVLHPRQVSLTLYRVWEAAQGTRLPSHLSWLQTGPPELSHAHAGQRPKPAAASGSTASSGRRRPALWLRGFQWT